MRTFGGYETVQEIFRGPLGSVFSARRAGQSGPPGFVVKTCEPVAEILGAEAAEEAVSHFLDAAEVQKAAAGAGTHWAAVHEIGRTQYGAFVVMDLFERGSVERLSTGRVRFDARALKRLAQEILSGLAELETVRGRPHGTLKASNVMVAVGPGGGLESATVALSDPMPTAMLDAERGRVDDLRGVGRLLYQVVAHQPFREGTILPLAATPEWAALGKGGDAWRELCSKLLAAEAGSGLTLEGVQAEAAALGGASAGGGKGKLLVIGAAAGVVLLGGVAAVVLSGGGGKKEDPGRAEIPVETGFDAERWRGLVAAYRDWFGAFERDMRDGARLARLEKDPQLAPIAAKFRDLQRRGAQLDPRVIAGIDPGTPLQRLLNDEEAPEGARSAAASGATAEAFALVEMVQRAMTAEGWSALGALRAAETAFGERGWESQKAALEVALGYAEIRSGARVADAIDAVMAASAVVRTVEGRWGRIEGATKVIAATGDAVLARFAGWAAGAGAGSAGSATGVDALKNLDTALAEVEALAEELRGFVRSGGEWETVDQELFQAESKVHKDVAAGGAVSRDTFRDWVFQAPSFRSIDPELDPRRGWREVALTGAPGAGGTGAVRAPAALADVLERRRVLSRELSVALDERTEGEIARVVRELEQVGALRWNRTNQTQVTDMSRSLTGALDTLAASLGQRVEAERLAKAQGWAEVVAQVRGRAEVVGGGREGALNAAWQRWRDALLAEVDSGGAGNASELVTRARGIEEIIKAVDAGVPRGAEGLGGGRTWSDAFAQAAAAERERALAGVVGELGARAPGDASVVAPAVERAAGAYGAYIEGLRSLSASAAEMEGLLNQAHDLGEGVGELAAGVRGRLAGMSGGVATALEPVLSRVAQLEQIAAGTDREALVRLVQQARADRPEQAVAAWRRLGGLPQRAWPASLEELSRERTLREVVERVAESVQEPARRSALSEEIRREGPARWERVAASLREPAQIEQALAQMGAMGVAGAEQVSDAGLRFNALVYALKARLAETAGDEDAALRAVDGFLADAGRLPEGVRSRAAGVIGGLGGVAESFRAQAAGAAPRVDVASLGPGSAGWRGEEQEGGRVVVFRRAGPGGEGLELRFVLVDGDAAAGREPVYVQDREVSLGLFTGIVDAESRWSAVGRLMDLRSRRDGPAVWQTAGDRIARSDRWTPKHSMFDTGAAPYAPEFRDPTDPTQVSGAQGVPRAEMPMQHLSAAAALYVARLAGCRLPTSAEWLAAHEADARGADLNGFNLRDRAWDVQKEYVRGVRASLRLNAHVYIWPDEGAFVPADQARIPTKEQARARQTDDGRLWFWPVETGPGRLKNLVGNVAELVFDDPVAAEALDLGTPEAFDALLSRNGQGLRVLGGSAMSAPEIPIDRPSQVDEDDARVGFADVGMRLAFPASGASARERLATAALKLLGPEGYLPGS